jgi:hypothetical protein
LLAKTYLACQSPIPGIDIHFCQLYFPTITNPKISLFIPQELPNQNSKEFKLYEQGRVELSSLKKEKKKEKLHPKELQMMEIK